MSQTNYSEGNVVKKWHFILVEFWLVFPRFRSIDVENPKSY